ncbi:hypothetical protein [Collimonas humicola]|uniref:hypothetical protein n=1 Tax=Collimonas humicola TaxID=2825886 RepID=UPI001B8C1E4A|nr:hypothetical protein [Collimonas humicola]
MPKQHAEYNNAKTEKVSTCYTKLKETAVSSTGAFDSASAGASIADAQSLSASITGVEVPEDLQILFDESGDGRAGIAGAILDGAAFYEAEHGVEPTADHMATRIMRGSSGIVRSNFAEQMLYCEAK